MNKEINVGLAIKNIRKQKKIFLKDVAEKSGISSSMLSQIEKGNANPSLNTIKAIADVLEVPLFKLFLENTEEENKIQILKKEDRKIISTKNVNYELISPGIPTELEVMKMIFNDKFSESSLEPKEHKGEEIALVLKGMVKIIIENNSAIMEEGDSVHIPASKAHKWINLSDDKSIVIFAVTPPEF
ncbi:MAG: helix-turn-helix domain-containing protein [Fusobacterium sp. JB019]|nr:helix-turn-helix domain-containing protein [Fusobacterium sp. JB019]